MTQMKIKLGRGSNAAVSVTDMIDHIVEEGDKLYKGTEFEGKWILYASCRSSTFFPGRRKLKLRPR